MGLGVRRICLASLVFFRRRHLALCLACAVSAAVLLASFIAGDSLSHTLERRACLRLGGADGALRRGGELFQASLAAGEPILHLKAAAVFEGRAREVDVYGVGPGFFGFSKNGEFDFGRLPKGACINESLASSIGCGGSGRLTLALFTPSGAPIDSAFSLDDGKRLVEACDISGIVRPEDMGDFSLENTQAPPLNVFVDRAWLSEILGADDAANISIFKAGEVPETLSGAFLRAPLMSDYGLFYSPENVVKSKNWFLPPLLGGDKFSGLGKRSLAWFLNSAECGASKSHYAFAIGLEGIPPGKVRLNSRIADRLGAKPGCEIKITYFTTSFDGSLRQKASTFTVDGFFGDAEALEMRRLMPRFEGLSDAGECSQWRSKIPIDFSLVAKDDEDYWEKYSYAPKLALSYSDAARIWGGPMGDATAFEVSDAEAFGEALASQGWPVGFSLDRLGAEALANARDGVDFAPLFAGLSFFVVAAALALQALSAILVVRSRSDEVLEYSVLGFGRALVFKIFFAEFLCVLVAGIVLGLVLGLFFSFLLLALLNGIWSGVAAGSGILFHADAGSFLAAFALSFALGAFALWAALRSALKKMSGAKPFRFSARAFHAWVPGAAFALSALMASVFADVSSIAGRALVSVFLLCAFLSFCVSIFLRKRFARGPLGFFKYAFISFGRRGFASFAILLMASIATYLLAIVGLNKFVRKDLESATSPSGAYDFIVKTALPASGVSGGGFDILPLKSFSEASADCLNLNRVPKPRVLGVDAEALKNRKAFAFEKYADGVNGRGWGVLDEPLPDGEIPAVVDSAALMWSMKMKVGDLVEYGSSDFGPLRLRIVAATGPTPFMGSLIVSNENFSRIVPASDGAKLFLCGNARGREAELGGLFLKHYPTLESMEAHFEKFDALQNSYLKIFFQLGILGLLLGFSGCGILGASAVLSNSGEYACLLAVGWRESQLANAAALEPSIAVFVGSLCGALASFPVLPDAWRLFPALLLPLIAASAAFCFSRFAVRKAIAGISIREDV